jgi:AcrR family transcriptional regulator
MRSHEEQRSYHHGDLRNALIRAGLELLAEGGAAALDLRKVARKAGVSHAAPYRHFADKQALIAAINEEGYYRLVERMRAARAQEPDDDIFAQLLAIALAYIHFAIDNPWLMREMFSGLTVERESYPDLYEASKQVFKQYAEVITRGQQQGSIVQGEVGGLAGVLWSLLHGVAMLIIENQMSPYVEGPEKIEHMALLSVQTLYRGMGGR